MVALFDVFVSIASLETDECCLVYGVLLNIEIVTNRQRRA